MRQLTDKELRRFYEEWIVTSFGPQEAEIALERGENGSYLLEPVRYNYDGFTVGLRIGIEVAIVMEGRPMRDLTETERRTKYGEWRVGNFGAEEAKAALETDGEGEYVRREVNVHYSGFAIGLTIGLDVAKPEAERVANENE